MMRPSNELPTVYLCHDIVDFLKGINGLAILVEEALGRVNIAASHGERSEGW